jgi:hypothetical protein
MDSTQSLVFIKVHRRCILETLGWQKGEPKPLLQVYVEAEKLIRGSGH